MQKNEGAGGDRGCRNLYNYTYKNLLLLKNGQNKPTVMISERGTSHYLTEINRIMEYIIVENDP